MKRLFVAAFSAAAGSAFAAAPSLAQTPYNWAGAHVGLSAGAGWGNADISTNFFSTSTGVFVPNAPISPGSARLHTSGFIGGGQLGYDTTIGSLLLGVEGDFAGSTVNGKRTLSGIDVEPLAFTETQKLDLNWLATLRVRAGYELFPGWMPYLTGGLAFADMKGTSTTTFPTTGVTYNSSTTTIRTGGVVGAGVDFMVMPNLTVGAQYLYMSLNKFSTQGRQSPGGFFTKTTSFTPQFNVFRLTVNYHFWAPAAPPPTPVAAPPPVAAPAPQKQMFIVFFEFDKSSLTADGRKVVDAAAAAFKQGKSGVAIAGYTDLAGSQQYNLALSKRRADTVKQGLVRDGVPAAAIDEKWFGKQNPRVPTADGVREPQNRRVEVTM
jgi:outer membrane protein OmpA-like peptidoglycan-associated protein